VAWHGGMGVPGTESGAAAKIRHGRSRPYPTIDREGLAADTPVRCGASVAALDCTCEGNRWLVRRPLFLGATRGLVGAGIKPRAATATPFSSSPGGGPYPLCLGSRHGWQLHRLSSMCCVYYPTVEATVASDPLTESYS
jgi:hypothetical protein